MFLLRAVLNILVRNASPRGLALLRGLSSPSSEDGPTYRTVVVETDTDLGFNKYLFTLLTSGL